jgi:ankyrin repeat protein
MYAQKFRWFGTKTDEQRGPVMKQWVWLSVFFMILTADPGFAITPEAARKELAQENIPYPAEAMIGYIEQGNTEVVGWFLSIGMHVDARNEFGESGLMLAAEQGHLEMVKLLVRLLISSGADVNAADVKGLAVGETPLIVAAMKGKTNIAALLIAEGAKVNSRTKDGQTALIYAASAPDDRTEVVRLLIEKGADVNAKDKTGMTALDYALKKRDLALFKILMEAGARE